MPGFQEADTTRVSQAVSLSSLLIWLPHCLALAYSFPGCTSTEQLLILVFIATVAPATYFTARKCSGDAVMIVMFVTGFLSEAFELGSPHAEDEWDVSRNAWMIVFIVQGLFAGILCKAKDMQDDRFYESYTIAERLYLVVPFTVGTWTGYIVTHGFIAGFARIFTSTFFCLALVGYGAVGHRMLGWSGAYGMDLIQVLNHLFTTSFGAVFSSLVVTGVFGVYLAVPFITHLLTLNAVVSTLGILVEFVVYDLA